MKIPGQGRERGVVGEALKELADIRDPEGTLEARANFAQSFRKSQKWLLNFSRNSSSDIPAIRITFIRLFWPDAMVTEERGTFKS